LEADAATVIGRWVSSTLLSAMENKPTSRCDGLVPGQPFLVIQLFDREGYHSSCVGRAEDEVREKACGRLSKTLLAFSLPFAGTWSKESAITPNITMPADFKQVLAMVNKPVGDE